MMNPAIRVLWQRHGLAALLVSMALVFLVALGVETDWGQALRPPLPEKNSASRAGDMVATLPEFTLPPLDIAFKETAERPLFTPTRRPAPVNVASAPAMKRGQFKLSGTSVSSDLTVAFLLEIATGKTVRVTKGKEINSMTLAAVEPNRVVLKMGDETEELTLRTSSSPPVVAAAPAPAGIQGMVPPAGPLLGAGVSLQAPRPVVPPAGMPQPGGPPNPAVPAPGSAGLPGFVMPQVPGSPQVQVAPLPESANTAQRRRRTQIPPPQ